MFFFLTQELSSDCKHVSQSANIFLARKHNSKHEFLIDPIAFLIHVS